MFVGLISYYKLSFDGEHDGLRENGNLRFLEFYKVAKEKNIEFELYQSSKHSYYDLILLYIKKTVQITFLFLMVKSLV